MRSGDVRAASTAEVQVDGVSELIVREVRLRPYGGSPVTARRQKAPDAITHVERRVPRAGAPPQPSPAPREVRGGGLEASR